jgi:transcription initiation factor IIF auxiliary subunit
MEIQQSEEYLGDNWWKWSVWIEGPSEALDAVDFVEWQLHPTFPNPIRRVTNRGSKFRLDTGGWGVFMIRACAQRKDGATEKLHHHLQLHFPERPAVAGV